MLDLLKDTFHEWSEDKAQTLGAALAYYTTFSLAPLLIIAIAVAGLVFGQQAASGQIFEQIRGMVGDDAARMIEGMVANASKPSAGLIGGIIGAVTLLMGAAGVFGQLKQSMNIIWEAKPKGSGIGAFIKNELLSFTMVLGMGFLLLVSLILTAALAGFASAISTIAPGLGPILRVIEITLSLGIITLLFAMIFKILPDVEIRWSDVWIGAFSTAVLFTIGKELIGLYIGLTGVGSVYGAAGALVVILVWIFYSAQILFLGAEFTQVHAKKRGTLVGMSAASAFKTEQAKPQFAEGSAAGAHGQRRGQVYVRPRQARGRQREVGGLPKLGYLAAVMAFVAGVVGAARMRRT